MEREHLEGQFHPMPLRCVGRLIDLLNLGIRPGMSLRCLPAMVSTCSHPTLFQSEVCAEHQGTSVQDQVDRISRHRTYLQAARRLAHRGAPQRSLLLRPHHRGLIDLDDRRRLLQDRAVSG